VVVLGSIAVGFVGGRMEPGGIAASLGLATGLALAAWGIARTAGAWIVGPINEFASLLERLGRAQRDAEVRALPTDRDDEVGRMAAAVRQIVIHRIRDHHDARQLRRTLDDRVRRATRSAVHSLQTLAMRDPLTGLGNRRFLEAQLPPLVEAATASDTDLICLMIDLDNFKPVNDTLGHQTGDELIVILAELIRSACRDDDLAVRLGGDEFVMFLPGATLERAEQVVAQVRRYFRERANLLLGGVVQTDLSIGAASMVQERCPDGQALIDQADRHLYRAKRSGKGMTCSLRGTSAA
jgi:diguanylate cyclase (GGDEF)-like protein